MTKQEKTKKYKAFNITREELDAILAGQEQMITASESSGDDYAQWANKQCKLISSFYKKIKIQ